jgi:hypothetical protein
MSTGLTNTVLLIGHADAVRLHDPFKVDSMAQALAFLGNDYTSPLVAGLLEAYAAGCRDMYVYAVAPMSEYEQNPALRLDYRVDWGGKNFYQLYKERLDEAYSILLAYDFFELVVPIEAPFYDDGTRGALKYVEFTGTAANYLSTPDAAPLDITGDLTVVARVAMDDWSPAAIRVIGAKYHTGTPNRAWYFQVSTTGTLGVVWSTDGTATLSAISTANLASLADGAWKWVAFTLDVENGASGRSTRFWTSDDGESWTQLGNTVTQAGVTSIFNSSAILEVGSRISGSDSFTGKISHFSVRDGIGASGQVGGTEVFRFDAQEDFYMKESTITSFTASSGQTVTITKSVSTPLTLTTGKVDLCTQLANFCADCFTLNSHVAMGIMGTRVPNLDVPDQKITNYNATTVADIATDSRIPLLGEAGKFVMVVVGEGVFIPEKAPMAYNRSLEVATAGLIATTTLGRSMAGQLLPGVASLTSQPLTGAQIESLSEAKLNAVQKTAVGRRGASFQVRILNDSTLAEDYSDFYSAVQMRVISAVINKIRALGYAYIGGSYEEFRRYVYEFLNYLTKSGHIDQFEATINRDPADIHRAIVDVVIKPIIGIKNIVFRVSVGPGA